MADFNIDVGFNTEELKEATKGAATGGGTGAGIRGEGFAKGLKTALSATGIIALLASMKTILESISFILAFISSVIGLLVVKFLDFAIPFFVDSERNSVKQGIAIVNGFLTGVEFLVNTLAAIFTLGKVGVGENKIELPRFQEDIILEGFDNLRKAEENLDLGIGSLDDVIRAQKDYTDAVIDSFLTQGEFDAIKKVKDFNNETFKETLLILNSAGEDVGTAVDSGATQVISFTDTAFSAMSKALKHIEDKANEFTGSGSTSEEGDFVRFKADEKKSIFEKNLDFIKGLGDPDKFFS